MNSRRNPTDWRQLREFRGVDMEGSYVVGWRHEAGLLSIDMDILLTPDHPFYETPRPSQKGCIRAAVIEFPYCRSISRADDKDRPLESEAAVATLEHGAVQSFCVYDDGVYEITGVFGHVVVEAERPVMRLTDT